MSWNVHPIISRSGFGPETTQAFQVRLWMVLLLSTLILGWVTKLQLLGVWKTYRIEGTATAHFPDTSCDFPSHLWDHIIVINLTLCKLVLLFSISPHTTELKLQVVTGLARFIPNLGAPPHALVGHSPVPFYDVLINAIKTLWITIQRPLLMRISILLLYAFTSKTWFS